MVVCNFLFALAGFYGQIPFIGGFFAWLYDRIRDISFLGCT